ncbi:MAG: ribosome biogenesis GTP-binding protein YihA/YsxC [Oscillospiraceae bacterium]|nr:ribosome biogenesis GTP-binding protein YihA/YsxC [Oscillospiraceae bacterium]
MNFNDAKFLTSYGTAKQLERSEGLEFVFCGRSNVGKSSLINKILNRKSLAKTSSTPGKTATINFYKVDEIFFVDLPGYGYAKVSRNEKRRWNSLIDAYFSGSREFALIIQLIDIRHKPSELDLLMVNFLIDASLPFVVVLTKEDKISKTAAKKRKSDFAAELPCGDQIKIIPFSAVSGEGTDELRRVISEMS